MGQQLPTFSIPAQTAAVGAIAALLNGGSVNLYSGSRPSSPNQLVASLAIPPLLIATLTLPNPAFAAAANGAALANAITAVAPSQEGHADWFRAFETGGTVAVIDGNCAADGSADLWLTAEEINSNVATVGVTSWTLRVPTRTANTP